MGLTFFVRRIRAERRDGAHGGPGVRDGRQRAAAVAAAAPAAPTSRAAAPVVAGTVLVPGSVLAFTVFAVLGLGTASLVPGAVGASRAAGVGF